MFNQRLMHMMGRSKKYVLVQVLFQWISLLCNIGLNSEIARFLSQLSAGPTWQGGKTPFGSCCPPWPSDICARPWPAGQATALPGR